MFPRCRHVPQINGLPAAMLEDTPSFSLECEATFTLPSVPSPGVHCNPRPCVVLQIEHQLWSARQQIEGMLAAAGREGASVLQELEGRLRGISDVDLVAWEHW